MLTGNVAAAWKLAKPAIKHAIGSNQIRSVVGIPPQNSEILAVNEVEGARVPLEDYAPGGRYRGMLSEILDRGDINMLIAIVKLVITYKGLPEIRYIGTGWLINQDLIVTAGHNAFHWREDVQDYGSPAEVLEVEAYVGYQGIRSLQTDLRTGQVQYRRASSVVTTREYFCSVGQRQFDLALFKLNKPFENVTPLAWENTPSNAKDLYFGMVGYPADRVDDEEAGAKMYEMFTHNLHTTQVGVLQYSVDNYGGKSGWSTRELC